MYGVPDFYQNDNVKKGTGMQWRHQVVSDLPSSGSRTRPGRMSGRHSFKANALTHSATAVIVKVHGKAVFIIDLIER